MADRVSLATLALAKAYTDTSIEGAGAIKGKNCEIQSVTPIEGGNRVTFAWYNGSDVLQTTSVDVMDGEQGEQGEKGETGDTGATGTGIESIEKISSVGLVDTYQINLTDGTSYTFTVTNATSGDYSELSNQPQINGVTLVGNKTSADLGISITGEYSNENLILS